MTSTTAQRTLVPVEPADYGRAIGASEPFVYHCNHYNFWFQNTLLLDESLGMESYLEDAAAVAAHRFLTAHADEAGLTEPEQILAVARDQFAEHGFGTIDYQQCNADGGLVVVPTSHSGQAFREAIGSFRQAQNVFDRGWAAGSLAAAYGQPPGSFRIGRSACHSLGAAQGEIELIADDRQIDFRSPGEGGQTSPNGVPARTVDTAIDEDQVMAAVATLDFSGNEEGLIPRFGVMLTRHFANFYNLGSFEFLDRMGSSGMVDVARHLLVNAAYQCGFRTFGGIMISPEWDAVVRPQIQTQEDWVHGMVAIANCLGWGTARVQELSSDRLVVRVYDDYEAKAYAGARGEAPFGVSFLAQGGYGALMNLVYVGDIASKPVLDGDYYSRVFESSDSFTAEQTACIATGDEYTEITVSR